MVIRVHLSNCTPTSGRGGRPFKAKKTTILRVFPARKGDFYAWAGRPYVSAKKRCVFRDAPKTHSCLILEFQKGERVDHLLESALPVPEFAEHLFQSQQDDQAQQTHQGQNMLTSSALDLFD